MGSKKKVGIITLHNANNYGAVYQAYALSKYIESMKHHSFIINYHIDKAGLLDFLKHPVSVIRKIFSRRAFSLSFFKARVQQHKGKKKEEVFHELFSEFRSTYLNITTKVYDYKTLEKECPPADIFITGSDQVWAADFIFSSPAYLLAFAPSQSKKISYAPSFGKQELEPYLQNTFRKHINQFHAISVRESSGRNLIKSLAGKDATKVLDPTLLLDDYLEIIDYSLVPEGPYALSYRLHQDFELTKWMTESIDSIGASMKLPLYSVSTNCPWSEDSKGESLYPSPGQLLGLIEKSNLFITNSFHGTVFGILFRKNFIVLARDSFKNKQNLRMIELLGAIGASERYCGPFSDLDEMREKLESNCDYDEIHRKLDQLRISSREFLTNALQ